MWKLRMAASRLHQPAARALLLPVLLSSTVSAGQTIEEIVVTAQKRAQAVQDIPIAITALDSDALERSQIENVNDLMNFVPNLQFGNFSSTATAAIRGIGYTNTTAGGDPGVALHLDGVYIARPIATVFGVWDLERMEVLRGPQGTLYGRNTTGGSINFISAGPTDRFEGRVDVAFGEFNLVQGRGLLNVPLGDRAAFRISATAEQADGYQENAFPGGTEAGDRDAVTVRAQLRFDFDDDVDLNLAINHSQIGGVGSTSESRFPYPTNPLLNWVGVPPPFVNTIFSDAFISRPDVARILAPQGITTADDVRNALGVPPGGLLSPSNPNFAGLTNDTTPNRVSKNSAESNDQEFSSFSAILNWDTGIGTWRWTTAYVETSFDNFIDLDASERTLVDLVLEERQEQISTELTLASTAESAFEWIVGVYYFNEDASRFSTIFADDFDRLGILFNRAAGFRVGGDVEATSYAVFAQGTVGLTENLNLTVGGRMSWDEKDAVINLISPFPAFNFMTLVQDGAVSDSWQEPSGKLTLDYRLSEDVLAYASFAHGYKSGGVNLNGAPAFAIYDPEFNDVYEVGLKTQFASRFQLNTAIFRNDYTDIQVQTFGAAGAELRNAAEATINGAEVEGLLLVGEGFELNFALGLLDGKFDNFVFVPPAQPVPPLGFPPPNENPARPPAAPPTPVNFAGNKLSRAPEVTFSTGLQQRFNLGGNGGEVTLRADYYYQDKQFFAPDNGLASTADSYHNLDLRAFWRSASQRWAAEVYLSNATDEDQIRDILISIPFLAGGVDLTTYQAPRQWGVRVGYAFGQ